MLTGLLAGLEGRAQQEGSDAMRRTLEGATVKAANISLREGEAKNEYISDSIAVLLSQAFGLLSDGCQLDLDHDLLLPIVYYAPLFARGGLHYGYFLSTIDADILQSPGMRFDWSSHSSTYARYQRMVTGPLVASLGPLSRLMAFSIEHVQDWELLFTMVKDLATFSRSLSVQWRQNKLSEIDLAEESTYLSEETMRHTIPLLWRVLRSTMFAIIVALQALLRRVLDDSRMPSDGAPFVSAQALHILRNLFFVSSRQGANGFSQYTFVCLTAIDIISQYPLQSEAFLRDIRPASRRDIPQHPLDRCSDLYFLNIGEHFAIVLSPEANENLLVHCATPYLGLGGDSRLLEIFEAAHSVMLAVFSAPQNIDLLAREIHPYVSTLFHVFPSNLSARQFRIAIKTLVRITSAPAPISETLPLLPSEILELVRLRLESISTRQTQPPPGPVTPALGELNSGVESFKQPVMLDQAVLVLALIDALPYLPIDQLEDWLPFAADAMTSVKDTAPLELCKQRFWDVLSSGEMDVNRAGMCLNWWGTRGGRELVLVGSDSPTFMSGALQKTSRL